MNISQLTKQSENIEKSFPQASKNSDPHFGSGPVKLTKFELPAKTVTLYGHTSAILCLSLCYDSFSFLSGSADSEVRLWTARTSQCLAVFQMHIQPVLDVCYCPKGFFFASGGADKMIYLWCSNKKAPLKSFRGHLKEVTQVGFTMNMIYLISASLDNSVRLWNIKETNIVRIFYSHSTITK